MLRALKLINNFTSLFFQKYYHGESIAINVLVDNNTSKTVKKVKLSGKITFFWWLFTHV